MWTWCVPCVSWGGTDKKVSQINWLILSLKSYAREDSSLYHSFRMNYDKQCISLNTEGINEGRILLLWNPVGAVRPKNLQLLWVFVRGISCQGRGYQQCLVLMDCSPLGLVPGSQRNKKVSTRLTWGIWESRGAFVVELELRFRELLPWDLGKKKMLLWMSLGAGRKHWTKGPKAAQDELALRPRPGENRAP